MGHVEVTQPRPHVSVIALNRPERLLETSSLRAAIDLEGRNQLLVRLTTDNLGGAIRARKEGRPPDFRD